MTPEQQLKGCPVALLGKAAEQLGVRYFRGPGGDGTGGSIKKLGGMNTHGELRQTKNIYRV
jgi:hypothetical protein